MPILNSNKYIMRGGEIKESSDCYNYKTQHTLVSYMLLLASVIFSVVAVVVIYQSKMLKNLSLKQVFRPGNVRGHVVLPYAMLGLVAVLICGGVYLNNLEDVKRCMFGSNNDDSNAVEKSYVHWGLVAGLLVSFFVSAVLGYLLVANSNKSTAL